MSESDVIKPGKDVVASMAEEFKQSLLDEIKNGIKELVIDLTGVEVVDSVGLGVMIATHNSLSKSGGKLKVVNASEDICRLFQTMRLDQHFEIQAAG
jgi:anti-anti-sigma factor